MQVKVNATHSERAMLSQVSLYVSILEIGDEGATLMSRVTKRVAYLLDFMAERKGCVTELQACGLRPHLVLQETDNGGSKRHERVQSGYEAYASITIHVPFGYSKLNPIADAVKHIKGTLTARYTMSDNMKNVHEAAIRCKLVDKAMKQCTELLSHTDGSARAGVVIEPVHISYHTDERSDAVAYKASERSSGVCMESTEDESSYDLDSIYTRENAQYIMMKDSVTVTFNVEGYSL